MADENTNTAETAASQNTPETGVDAHPKDTASASAVASIATQENGANDDLSEKLGMWKHQARENEQKMHENRDRANAAEAKLADTEDALAKANVQIARLTAQKQHPEITDEAFDALCRETDPDGIIKWADSFVQFMPSKPETGEHDSADDSSRNTGKQAMKTALSNSAPHVHAPAQGDAKSGYEFGLKHSLINSKKE